MNQKRGHAVPWWLTIQLWGLDAPVAAVCWALAYADLMDMPMITSAPLLLLAATVWLFTIASRLYHAIALRRGWYVFFYRSHMAPLALLILCVAAATLWMLFYYVGQILLLYAVFPFIFLLLGYVSPFCRRVDGVRGFWHASAFAMACAVPAAFYSVLIAPVHMLTFSPNWYLAILMFLYYLVRSSWQLEEDSARKRGLIVSVGLVLLFIICMMSAGSAPLFERSFCLTIGVAVACLELLVRLRPRLSQDALFSVGWLAMALPPVLGMLVF